MILNNGKIDKVNPTKQLTGEKVPGDLNSWDYFGTDPNDILRYNYNILCQRATTLYHTHSPVSAAINKTSMYAVGPGLKFRSQPDWRQLGINQDAAKDWGSRFQALVHYTFLLLNFYQKQSVLFRTADIMGDSLLMFDRTEQENGMPFDIIEAGGDSINFRAAAKNGEQITLGIIHDKFLRRKGIVQDDINQTRVMFKDKLGDQNILQFYHKYMARQLRGFPLPYKVIAACKNNDRYWDSILSRAVMESLILGVASNTQSDVRKQMEEMAGSVTNENGVSPANNGLSTVAGVNQINPGGILQMQGKGELKFSDMKTPSNNFDKLQTAFIDIVGMACDVPPEVLMSKYNSSFTAHKGALNDFVKSYTMKRTNLENNICYPVLKEVAKFLFMNKYIEMPKPDFFTNPFTQMATLAGNWLGPVPGHINPSVEVDALIKAKDNAFITPADAAATYGNEWDNQIEEWQAQMDEWNKRSAEQQAAALASQEAIANSKPDEDNNDENKDDKKNEGDDE